MLFVNAVAFGQIGLRDDSTKYIRYQNQYGMRMPRLWADSAFHLPSFDTTIVKPQKAGAIMMHLDGNVYKWNGGGWDVLGGTSITLNNIGSGFRWVATPGGNIKTAFFGYGVSGDSTTNADAITVQADTSETNHLITQSDLNDAIGGVGVSNLNSVLALGGRLSANRSVSMAHMRWDNDSAAFRLRGVDSVAISIDLAKAGDILRFNKPEGVARTYPGSTPFKFIMENSTDDVATERNNPVKWGWNINRADSTNAPGIWFSMEPNYRPGGAKWLETIFEVSLPNGTLKNSRLFMSTFKRNAGDSIEGSENQWDFRGTGWSFMNLTSTIGYVSMGAGSLNVNNSTAGPTDFSISNGSDIGHFNIAPGTSILDYTGPKFRVNGAINFSLKNGTSTERELISFEGDGGTTGYIGKYNSAWSVSYLQNAMAMLAASGNPTETGIFLKPNGTAWLGNIDAYNTGTQKVNIAGSLAFYGIGTTTTAPRILVWKSDSAVYGMDTASFRTMMGIGSDGNGIYGGNGSLPSNVTVTGGNNSITFDDIFAFKINSDYNTIAKANGTGIFTEAIIGSPNQYWLGATPSAGVYSKGAGVVIDTNNNVGVGAAPPTTMPLYATGASLFVQGLQSNHGNYYKVSNITSDGSAGLQAYFYTIDATAGNVTVTLPAASTAFGNTMGITYKFQRIDNSGNTVTIQRAGSDTINGGTSFTLTTQWSVKMMQCTSTSTWAQY